MGSIQTAFFRFIFILTISRTLRLAREICTNDILTLSHRRLPSGCRHRATTICSVSSRQILTTYNDKSGFLTTAFMQKQDAPAQASAPVSESGKDL